MHFHKVVALLLDMKDADMNLVEISTGCTPIVVAALEGHDKVGSV